MTLFGWIIRAVIVFVLLTFVYIGLTLTNRLREKDRLKDAFPTAETELQKEDFIDAGMAKYNKSLKAKLVFGVYLIPIALLALLIYLGQH